jgi:hypothetical protein
LAETGEEEKDSWPGWKYNTGKFRYCFTNCPLCEYCKTHQDHRCDLNCLLVWPGGSCTAEESPFSKWEQAKTPRWRKHWAKKISELPENK